MIDPVSAFLWLCFWCGVGAIAWLVSYVSVPQMDYEDDWRANL